MTKQHVGRHRAYRRTTWTLTALAAAVALGGVRVAAVPMPHPAVPPSPMVSADLLATLQRAPTVSAILALDVPADDDVAIARAQDRLIAQLGSSFSVTHRYAHVPALAGRLDRSGLARLGTAPGLAAASGDAELHGLLDESTVFIGSDRLRRQGVVGSGVNVAVIDTGVDATNLDLRGAVVAQLCTLRPSDRCGAGNNVADDLDGHGTHVASIVASRGQRASHGVASGAGIVAVKFLEERASGAGSDMIAALDLLLGRDDVDVINMSLGTNTLYSGDCDAADAYNRALAAAFGRLRAAGVIAVAASGNDGSPNRLSSPACIASVVSVGAVDDATRTVADFTNRGANLDLLAPGVGIAASGLRGNVEDKSGTSMAAPHVAGALALLKAEVPWAGPDLLEQVLEEHGQRPTVRLGGNEAVTIKVDDALAALRRITPSATPATPATPPTPTAPLPTLSPTLPPPSATPSASPPATATEAGPTPSPSSSSTLTPTRDVPITSAPSPSPSPVPVTLTPDATPRAVYLPLLSRP